MERARKQAIGYGGAWEWTACHVQLGVVDAARGRFSSSLLRSGQSHWSMSAKNGSIRSLKKESKGLSSVHNRKCKSRNRKANINKTITLRTPTPDDSCCTRTKVFEKEFTVELPATLVNLALLIRTL